MISRAAHRRAVTVSRQLGVAPTRRYPEHPSVVRVEADFKRTRYRADSSLRRLTDLFREGEPRKVGLWAASQWSPRGSYHRCADLGTVMVAGHPYAVILCRHHRERQPRPTEGNVGAEWLRLHLPELHRQWQRDSYKPNKLERWRRLDENEEQGFQRVQIYWTELQEGRL